MIPIFYNPSYVGSSYSFDTTRKSRWIAESLERDPIGGIEIRSPASLTREEIETVHDPAYVRAVESGEPRSAAQAQGFTWDPGLWEMVCASNGGVVAAARAAMQDGVAGSLSSGLHHARRERGRGFCTFNGLVIAAKSALADGAESVLIIDLDAHCGGGTHSLIADDSRIWQLDVSIEGFDDYVPSERTTLDLVNSPDEYLTTIRRRLDTLDTLASSGQSFGLCIYNAGMDPFDGCGTGGLAGIDMNMLAERERMVFDWCRMRKVPIAFVIAGGYVGSSLSKEGLVQLHRLTISAAREHRTLLVM